VAAFCDIVIKICGSELILCFFLPQEYRVRIQIRFHMLLCCKKALFQGVRRDSDIGFVLKENGVNF